MKIPLKKIRFRASFLIHYLFPLTIVLVIATLAGLGAFLYQNVYQTLAQAKSVTELKKEVAEQGLNKEKFQQMVQKIERKKEKTAVDFNALKNPFFKASPPASESAPKSE